MGHCPLSPKLYMVMKTKERSQVTGGMFSKNNTSELRHPPLISFTDSNNYLGFPFVNDKTTMQDTVPLELTIKPYISVTQPHYLAVLTAEQVRRSVQVVNLHVTNHLGEDSSLTRQYACAIPSKEQ